MDHTITNDGDCVIVALHSDIDLQYSGHAREVLLQATDEALSVVVGMSGVGMIDSSGVASLLEALQASLKRNRRFFLAAIDPSVDRVLKLARLETVFEITDDVAAAKLSLAEN